jgi:GTP-binding protein
MQNNQPFHLTYYMLSVGTPKQLPPDQGFEVAFAGRSNAGKSSLLNALVNRRQLAKTSKKPGRTQTINFFYVDDERRIVDLPGYGYAQVSATLRHQWQQRMMTYLSKRKCLQGICMLMDSRHPLQPADDIFLSWLFKHSIPVHIVLTKADKLRYGAAQTTLKRVQTRLADSPHKVSVQLCSAHTSLGIPELLGVLREWYGFA